MVAGWLTAPGGRLVDCADPVTAGNMDRSIGLGLTSHRDRRHVAIVVTSDGRRVQMPVDSGIVDVSLLLRALALGLESLLGLITGSRREIGGTRRHRRR